ncbi:MAG: NAD(+) synthase [Nitrososphaerales archaeon]
MQSKKKKKDGKEGGSLSLDCDRAEKEIVRFIRKVVKDSGGKGAVIGLSGGIDSSVVGALLVRALGRERVIGILMPASHTPKQDTDDGKMLAKEWGIRTYDVAIDPVFAAFEKSLPRESGTKIAYANVKARIRMIINYYVANAHGMLVAGTGDRSEDQIGFFCYDEKTRVVTVDGPRDLNQLRAGDAVFSIDLKTQQMVESKVDGVFRFPYEGQMIHFGGRGADVMVTPNHRMLVHTSSSRSDSRLVFRAAGECLKSRDINTPTPLGWTGDRDVPPTMRLVFEQRHIRRVEDLSIEDAFYLLGLFIGDGCVTTGKVIVPVRSALTRRECSSTHRDEGGRFVRIDTGRTNVRMKEYDTYETTFSLPSYTKDAARKRLTAVLSKYKIGYSLTSDTVRISSKGIHDFFIQCGVGSKNKHIPHWVLSYPSEYLVHLLSGLKDSDGSHPENRSYYYTPSEELRDDFVQLCFKLGRRASVTSRGPTRPRIKGKTIMTGPSFTISYASNQRSQHTIKSRLAKTVDYAGEVWCPSVPPFENLLVERNGKYVFSGNTKHGDGGVDFLPIAHLYKTQVRELGAHLGLPEHIVTKPSSPQLWPGHRAVDEIPIEYERLDPVLVGLLDEKLSPSEVARRTGVERKVVQDVLRRHRASAHKRTVPPMIGGW